MVGTAVAVLPDEVLESFPSLPSSAPAPGINYPLDPSFAWPEQVEQEVEPPEVRWGLRTPAAIAASFGRPVSAQAPLPVDGERILEMLPMGDPDIVHGLPINDLALVTAVRRVILITAACATYYIGTFIWQLLSGVYASGDRSAASDALWSGFSQLVIELTIPACGYYGALYAHRTLVFFFCGANLIFVIASIVNFVRLVIRGSTDGDGCSNESYSSAQSSCDLFQRTGPDKYMLLVSLIALTIFGCLSFGAGMRLYQGLGPMDSNRMPSLATPLVGEVVAQPPLLEIMGYEDEGEAAERPEQVQGHLEPAR